ncbi:MULTISPECIES: formate/nitrite transporter family protein [unclassified Haloferax]|uniref:formate/nitrite transporter family protein n=1 Tax=unclassified Haloferax TaxID=2625095 RepID=UPI0002AF89D1|nr:MULTISPECIES: formate/nitrite transporter family protein [unclassified Haloferax]ELZ55291.1 formate/nitrite transporter [Haloferax sp. ATCC BAA-646]ELZ66548.1 formate/nitrite transporter [Haloferax sp. ATCC BAA-645]ELZ66737.1 formate/nitrite transporter [Haloferax sp. ATCC BAA-644]
MTDSESTELDESVREAVERSRSGAPAVGSVVRDRFSSDEVFQRIVAAADEEITSGARELFFSALAAGFAITITFLLYVSMKASTGGDPVLSAMLYPLGFIYIIIGGYQLYTENTLPPVALTLERLASIPALLRNWVVVLAGNLFGGTLGAAALAFGGVLSPEAANAALELAQKGVETPWWSLFFKAAFAGLIVAGVVWVTFAARDTISRLAVVYLAFLAVPLGGLFHVVVSYTEMVYLVMNGQLAFLVGLTEFVIPVLLGNTFGGVVLVTVVNYFQTTENRLESARFEGAKRQLSIREWALGGLAGRSYVPLIETEEGTDDHTDSYRVVVPISNPRTESHVVELACALAKSKEDAVVDIVHVVQVPSRVSQRYGAAQNQRIIAHSNEQLEDARERVAGYDIEARTSTVVSHRSFEEIFTVASRKDADLVVMGWSNDRIWSGGRAERTMSELTSRLPCDFLVLNDRNYDTSRLLLPTVESPHSALSAEVAKSLRSVVGSEVTLLHVVNGPDERERGEAFLSDWATEHDLQDATRIVDDTGDIERAIADRADSHSMVLMGATERGLLTRLLTDSLHLDVVNDTDHAVLLVERATERSLRQRLFGR